MTEVDTWKELIKEWQRRGMDGAKELSKKVDVDYVVGDKIKKSHPYYAQVQVQMFCCGTKFAHFYVYGDDENTRLLTVQRDDPFL